MNAPCSIGARERHITVTETEGETRPQTLLYALPKPPPRQYAAAASAGRIPRAPPNRNSSYAAAATATERKREREREGWEKIGSRYPEAAAAMGCTDSARTRNLCTPDCMHLSSERRHRSRTASLCMRMSVPITLSGALLGPLIELPTQCNGGDNNTSSACSKAAASLLLWSPSL